MGGTLLQLLALIGCLNKFTVKPVTQLIRAWKQNLQTCATVYKITETKAQSQTVLLTANNEIFTRLLIIGKNRDVDLKELLAYALMPVPMSLGTSGGLVVPCAKQTKQS